MLTQGPAPTLNISSFLTLPNTLHCCICAKDIMITVLLLKVMEGWEGWGWFIYVRVSAGERGGHHIYFLIFVLFLRCC